ncbi:phosphatase PAP2 family protein [Patulibacter minatonensis]|uniref:phosphatase PAP2 family protein n=1 Tax=Patulibacter minatonensis TaxID=298163 RepID=UPI0004B0B387|nr:phosphatase PAP2 family protein [Patulibacter minatonensis]
MASPVPRIVLRPLPLVALALALIVGLGLLVTSPGTGVTRWDTDVVRWIADRRTSGIVDVAKVVTDLGNGYVVGVVLAVVGVLLAATRVLGPVAAAAPLLALWLGALASGVGKAIVGRPRPPLALHEVAATSSGFPSGHSTQSAAGWLALALVLAYARRGASGPSRRIVLAAGAVVVLLVGVSRVVLGVHSPTDVLAGWALGAACALLVVALLLRGRRAT